MDGSSHSSILPLSPTCNALFVHTREQTSKLVMVELDEVHNLVPNLGARAQVGGIIMISFF